MRERVIAARVRQQHRFYTKRIRTNAEMTSEESREVASMSAATERFAVNAAEKMMLSARGYYRLLKVARTIADIRSSSAVEVIDLAEALQYRAFSNAVR
jgi:magnesium chelatase family protein